MSEVIVFGMPQSTYVRSVRMACEEKGAAHVVEPIMPDQLRESGRHPFGRMPAMEHDGVRLFESSAILRYLDRTFDGLTLEPDDPGQALISLQWESALHDYLIPTMGRRYILQYIFPKGPDGEPDRAVIDAAVTELHGLFAILAEALAAGPFFFGAEPVIPDLLLAPQLAYIEGLPEGPELLGAAPPVQRLLDAMKARDSFQRTVPPPLPEAA